MPHTVEIRLKPSAKRPGITVAEDGDVRVAVSSPPVEGRANAELIATLAKRLGVPKSSCSIIRGATARTKVVAVEGLTRQEIIAILRSGNRK
jgi:hypothetical protein